MSKLSLSNFYLGNEVQIKWPCRLRVGHATFYRRISVRIRAWLLKLPRRESCSLRGSNPLRVTHSELILRLMHPMSMRPIKTKLYITKGVHQAISILLSLRRVRNFGYLAQLVKSTSPTNQRSLVRVQEYPQQLCRINHNWEKPGQCENHCPGFLCLDMSLLGIISILWVLWYYLECRYDAPFLWFTWEGKRKYIRLF